MGGSGMSMWAREGKGHHKGDFSRRMTGTFSLMSEGIQGMRHGACEPSFVEDLPPSSDTGALDPG